MSKKSCANCQCNRYNMESDWEEAKALDEHGIECSNERFEYHTQYGKGCQFFSDMFQENLIEVNLVS